MTSQWKKWVAIALAFTAIAAPATRASAQTPHAPIRLALIEGMSGPFADAGADCLYAPGIRTREHIEASVKAVGGKAVNFLNSAPLGHTVGDLAAMGVRRISVGGTLSRVAMHGFIAAATRSSFTPRRESKRGP